MDRDRVSRIARLLGLLMLFRKSVLLLSLTLPFSSAFVLSSWAKGHAPERLLTLRGGLISNILGASREPHAMTNLARFGASYEYVNDDLEKLTINEGPCIYVAGPANLAPGSTYGVVVECFDLIAEKETKSFAYSTDSAGRVVSSGNLSAVGEYGRSDTLFDVAAWKWVWEHVSPELEHRIAAERAQGAHAILANLYKVNAKGEHNGPVVTAPILTRGVDAEFSNRGLRSHISGVSIVSVMIDTDGFPRHIRSVLPLGYGMDEQAVKAIGQYRFKSSRFEGKPAPVQINIEVRFHR